MATAAIDHPALDAEDRYFLYNAFAIAAVVAAGFSTKYALGHSTFAAPLIYHLHGVAFMGWVAIFVTQSWLATRGPLAIHRRLGWLAAGWTVLLVILGPWITWYVVRMGHVPFFFQPQVFLIANPLTAAAFAGLTWAAIRMRHRTDWHRRLHVCGIAAIMGPAFGRMLPMPLLTPVAFETAVVAGLIFPVVGALRDRRVHGAAHPAWLWGIGVTLAAMLAAQPLARTPFGDWVYRQATAGYVGEAVPGMVFGKPPMAPLIAGQAPAI